MQHDAKASQLSRQASTALAVGVGALSFGAGVLVALFVPAGQSGWSGLALIPLWLLVEGVLGFLVILGSIPGKPERLSVVAIVLVGFYAGALLVPVMTT
uniref:Uncharacterized protein n=1 Tax=Aeromonas hydrophila TaxID=644 RepID=B7VER0_AERHY|nr:hypothetical protein [Aeromonas hydrophila]